MKELFTSACLSSIFSQISCQELSLDEIKTEVFSLPGLHPLFPLFVVIHVYPNPDLTGTPVTTITAILLHEHLLLSQQYHMFITPWVITVVSSMGSGFSDPPSSAQGRWQCPFPLHFPMNPTSFEIP